jgi:hypothetical protein
MDFIQYELRYKDIWDNFILHSKNGHFMFYRDYMEYHSDRFEDYSILCFERGSLVAVIPCSIKRNEKVIISHEGLTFGGVISDQKMSAEKMIILFRELMQFLQKNEFKRFIYKAIPHIYHTTPSEEDLYALFLENARLIRRDSSSGINLKSTVRYSKGRKWSINKAIKENIVIRRSEDFNEFMTLMKEILNSKFDVEPTHTAEEIQNLSLKFPDNIKLYCAYNKNEMLGGVLIFENRNVVHTQYIASSPMGKETGALDLLINILIKDIYSNMYFLSFGINNSKTTILNTGLSSQKEGFGARTIVHDQYEILL